ncbi:MAG: electron transport complex subunit RsxC [Ruminococcaceae bacterium]|nr:electron transport complex subunit RsxC [Oscillospiraceae bacterium]
MAFSFWGGIHPHDNKQYTRDLHVQQFPAADTLVVSMSQHIGVPCEPLVKKNDPVKKGQKIGDNTGLCVPVHSPVSGTVKAVEARPHSSGVTVMSVVIQNDHQDTLCEDIRPRTQEEVDALSAQELISIIREAGIVGMGGASFPTHVKLSGGIGKIDTIIVNAGECEPYITADDRLCREMPRELISGIQIIMRILGLSEAHIGIEDNKPEAIRALKANVADSGVIVDILPAKYPQGAEKQLIQAITGRQVPSGGLPAEVGCAVINAATCKAIHDAVYEGMPLIQRIVTVSGDILMEPKNLLVPIGTSYNDLLEACGHSERPYKVLCGGPMMGVAQFDLSVSTVKACNAITILGKKNRFTVNDPHCIRCGKCIDVCPMHLMPVLMYKALYSNEIEEMNQTHLMDCCECGCCAYNCPAGVPLVLAFRSGKQKLRDAAMAAKK